MSTMVLRSFLLVVLLTVDLSYACNVTRRLPDLERRARDYKVDGNEPLVNDLLLRKDWYRVSDFRGHFRMPDSTVNISRDGCGTINQIYIQGTHPDVPLGTTLNVIACIQGGISKCYKQINVSIRNCSNELQYLLPTTGQYQAYCFDRPSIQGISYISAAPTNFNPGVVTISSNLSWTLADKVYTPELYFKCYFKQTENLYYTVTWIVNGLPRFYKGLKQAIGELRLTSTELVEAGFYLGIEVQCGVQASVNQSGSLTPSTFSNKFFAGIQIFNHSITLNNTVSNVTIWFRSTVPIGCLHLQNDTCQNRELAVHMKDPVCPDDVAFRRCSRLIELLARNEAIPTETTMYAFHVSNTQFKHTELKHYQLHLQTADSPDVPAFFMKQDLPIISVVVDHTGSWKPSNCYSRVDPHMKTFDGSHYENQESGDFVLYRNTKYRIEVQERTMPCNNNLAYCTCRVAVRAGADVFMINRCHGTQGFNEFIACKDGGILNVEKINENLFKILTPIGTVVQISTGHYENMAFMNVDIFSSPKDLNNTEGLCGYYDGVALNDFQMPSWSNSSRDTYGNTDHRFSRSWKVPESMTLLTENELPALENWDNTNSSLCICSQNNYIIQSTGENPRIIPEASCESMNTAECNYTLSISPMKCRKANRNSKRSFSRRPFNEEFFIERKAEAKTKRPERSVDVVPTVEEEVRSQCSNMIRNAPSVTQFPERLMEENIDEVIEQCVFDVMAADGDLSVGEIHTRSLNNVVKQTFSYEPTFVANNTEIIQIFLQATCSNNCSGKGVCSVDGECICQTLFHGPECELYERDPINVNLIQGDGVCDTALGDNCRCHWFYTNNLLENFSCKFRQFKLAENNTKSYMDEFLVPGNYDDMFTGQCCLPEARNKRSVQSTGLGYEWEMTISNDGAHYGSGQTLYIIDQTCLGVVNSSNNERGLMLKDGYCLINFQCVANTEMMGSDHCQTCSVQQDQFEWTNICRKTDEPKITIVGIALGSAVGAVVGVGVAILICWKLNNKKALVGTEEANAARCLDNSRSKFQMKKPAQFQAYACEVYSEHQYETIEKDRCTPDRFRVNDLIRESTPNPDRQKRPGSASGISFVLHDIPVD